MSERGGEGGVGGFGILLILSVLRFACRPARTVIYSDSFLFYITPPPPHLGFGMTIAWCQCIEKIIALISPPPALTIRGLVSGKDGGGGVKLC